MISSRPMSSALAPVRPLSPSGVAGTGLRNTSWPIIEGAGEWVKIVCSFLLSSFVFSLNVTSTPSANVTLAHTGDTCLSSQHREVSSRFDRLSLFTYPSCYISYCSRLTANINSGLRRHSPFHVRPFMLLEALTARLDLSLLNPLRTYLFSSA